MKKPIIGIVLDLDTKNEAAGGYSNFPWYALRTHYAKSISDNGGIPILIPYEMHLVEEYTSMCDGLVFPGGQYDIHPSYYGESVDKACVLSTNDRTNFELALLKSAMKKDIAILGICAGEQLMNVALGGTLHKHIPDAIKTNIDHKHNTDREKNWHGVKVHKNTLLHSIVKKEEYQINSHHHQAVNKLGKDLIVNAHAPDGVIEGIEHTQLKFCIGVEWHPEYQVNPEDVGLINAFVIAASR